jgi:hypothetical protein
MCFGFPPTATGALTERWAEQTGQILNRQVADDRNDLLPNVTAIGKSRFATIWGSLDPQNRSWFFLVSQCLDPPYLNPHRASRNASTPLGGALAPYPAGLLSNLEKYPSYPPRVNCLLQAHPFAA